MHVCLCLCLHLKCVCVSVDVCICVCVCVEHVTVCVVRTTLYEYLFHTH